MEIYYRNFCTLFKYWKYGPGKIRIQTLFKQRQHLEQTGNFTGTLRTFSILKNVTMVRENSRLKK